MILVKQFLFGPGLFQDENSADSYDFMALSREIKKADILEIAHWSARRGECLVKYAVGQETQRESWNFHPLPSGAFCISRTLSFPYITRHDSFTHGLIIPPNLLLNFANNPVLLIEHLEKLGFWQAGVEVLQQLLGFFQENGTKKSEAFSCTKIGGKKYPVLRMISVEGNREAVRAEGLRRMGEKLGVRKLAVILDAVLENVTTVITGEVPPLRLLKTIFDLLPVNCRPEFSFTTRTKFTQNHPYRIIFTGEDFSEQKHLHQKFHLPQISATKKSDEDFAARLPHLKNRWSMFMKAILQQKWEQKWREILILEPSPCEMDELPSLARQYFKKLGLRAIYEKSEKNPSVFSSEMKNEKTSEVPVKNKNGKLSEEISENSENDEERFFSFNFSHFYQKMDKTVSSAAEESIKAYFSAISGGAVGNPLAVERMAAIRETLLKNMPEDEREDFSEKLLEIGLCVWNEQKSEFPTRSHHQIEQMTDILYEIITESHVL